MGNVLAGAALVVVIVYAVYSIVQKIRHGSSCCGGHEPADKKIKVTDKRPVTAAYRKADFKTWA